MWQSIKVYTMFAETELIFREINTILFGNYNSWPHNIYNGSSQVYCLEQEGGNYECIKDLLANLVFERNEYHSLYILLVFFNLFQINDFSH